MRRKLTDRWYNPFFALSVPLRRHGQGKHLRLHRQLKRAHCPLRIKLNSRFSVTKRFRIRARCWQQVVPKSWSVFFFVRRKR